MYISYIERLNNKKICLTFDNDDSLIISEKDLSYLKQEGEDFIDDQKLADYYDVSVDYILDRTDNPKTSK